MNTQMNTDNYEAYLLDYLEGNLSPDEAEQLRAFVAAQGLDWDELTEKLPHLEAPQITYKGKEELKQRPLSLEPVERSKGRHNTKVIPLYVKIASAAAAGALLLTVALWPEKSIPKVEPIAELKPILPERLITSGETTSLPPRTMHFTQTQQVSKKAKTTVSQRVEMPLVAQLEPQKAQALPTLPTSDEPDLEFLAYRMNADLAFAQINEYDLYDYEDDERDLSFIGRGIYRLTDGRHDSFASLISTGLSTAKKEVSLAATDLALTAYYRADEHFEEAKERWEEKRGE